MPTALIITTAGINCDHELALAFETALRANAVGPPIQPPPLSYLGMAKATRESVTTISALIDSSRICVWRFVLPWWTSSIATTATG